MEDRQRSKSKKWTEMIICIVVMLVCVLMAGASVVINFLLLMTNTNEMWSGKKLCAEVFPEFGEVDTFFFLLWLLKSVMISSCKWTKGQEQCQGLLFYPLPLMLCCIVFSDYWIMHKDKEKGWYFPLNSDVIMKGKTFSRCTVTSHFQLAMVCWYEEKSPPLIPRQWRTLIMISSVGNPSMT